MNLSSSIRTATALAALATLGAVGPAHAADYVLSARSWGPAQDAAVAAAGGTVRFSHASGLAVASADGADFLAAALRGGAIASGAADVVLQQAPVRTLDLDVAPEVSAAPVDAFFQYVQWAPQSVRAPAAWAAGYTGRGVRVAVIDGGVYGAHPDLAANIDTAAARSFVPGAAGSCQAAWNCDTGTFWHGTHVSGIIAAPANGIGVVGIAPEATIVPVKALHAGSGSFASVIAAILYAATDGRADIINMSLGAVYPRREKGAAELDSALNRAVNFAASQGVLVVSSAGNDALDIDHTADLIVTPAQSGNGLAVSSTGPLGFALGATNFSRFSSYSNWGSSLVSLAGPGGDFALEGNALCTLPRNPSGVVTVPCWAFDMVLSTSRGSSVNGGYTWAAGTSMSAPAVAAVAALIKQKHPGLSVGALKNKLMNSAADAGKRGHDPYYGRGYVDAAQAVAD
ncbi:MAG: S8 family serine peptidase [Burkholderiales bacterium]|nr:S8 family serine peptidase [Burkholderiales bacterium]MDE2277380.1 S8 family serine peptidase [Burkholderiales bacterium]